MHVKTLPKKVWDEIVNAPKRSSTTSISLTSEHAEFLKHMPRHFLKDLVRDTLDMMFETQHGYLDAMIKKYDKELKVVAQRKAKCKRK